MKRFHIGYYVNSDRAVISGKTITATDIFDAISIFIQLSKKDAGLIKYVVEMDELITPL